MILALIPFVEQKYLISFIKVSIYKYRRKQSIRYASHPSLRCSDSALVSSLTALAASLCNCTAVEWSSLLFSRPCSSDKRVCSRDNSPLSFLRSACRCWWSLTNCDSDIWVLFDGDPERGSCRNTHKKTRRLLGWGGCMSVIPAATSPWTQRKGLPCFFENQIAFFY